MTIREKLLKKLYDNGLFEDQAEQVLMRYVSSDLGSPMQDRMGDLVQDYPPQLVAVTWIGLKKTALDWIDDNCPQHWARGMFA